MSILHYQYHVGECLIPELYQECGTMIVLITETPKGALQYAQLLMSHAPDQPTGTLPSPMLHQHPSLRSMDRFLPESGRRARLYWLALLWALPVHLTCLGHHHSSAFVVRAVEGSVPHFSCSSNREVTDCCWSKSHAWDS